MKRSWLNEVRLSKRQTAFETGWRTLSWRASVPKYREVVWQAAVGEQGIALQRADVLGLLGERRVGLALQFFEVSHGGEE